ncbi:Repressible alkaline phosphatase [Smittium mucronatum]|uniref:Alkaline phosphatase n=1 Tax=Smittium mucronatum TaxID=133383 RepID=A0A1R0H7R5_9FUNG|nr:Repressible alkaline phosphatase [Smittium mucronatum]
MDPEKSRSPRPSITSIPRLDSSSESSSSLLAFDDRPDHLNLVPVLPFTPKNKSSHHCFSNKNCLYIIFGSVVVGFFVFIVGLFKNGNFSEPSGPINVILMISDGFGPASETLARQFYQVTNDLPVSWKSPLDDILVGSSRTQSSDSLVTDSAAGATAFSCAIKSYNGAIGVDPSQKACGTVLEAAKLKGMLTGLIATSRITHATPGSFAAHVTSRDMEDLIAQYLVGNFSLGPTVDLLFGGGKCFFLPKEDPYSCRKDSLDLISDAQKRGFSSIKSLHELNSLNPDHKLPLLGLFSGSHMDYEIDRDPSTQPSLANMADKALKILKESSKKSNTGFFLMIEGSRIDMAAHSNDPATHVREIISYWDTVKLVRRFVDQNPNTVMISVSDHETGGLSVARQLGTAYPDYLWRPEILKNVKKSIEVISKKLLYFFNDSPGSTSQHKVDFVKNVVFGKWLEIHDYNDQELYSLTNATQSTDLRQSLSDIVSKRALLGWATHGHSAVDVNLYSHGYKSDQLRGNVENTDVGAFIRDILKLDLDKVTKMISNDPVKQKTPFSSSEWLG